MDAGPHVKTLCAPEDAAEQGGAGSARREAEEGAAGERGHERQLGSHTTGATQQDDAEYICS